MDPDRVVPELRSWVPKYRLPMESSLLRFVANGILGCLPHRSVPGVRFERRDGAAHGVRLFIPQERRSRGALLWIHGGGLIIGHPVMDDRVCAQTALELGIVVASARYRLAPAHPYPAAIDDCHAAWMWLTRNAASLDIDPGGIAIGGQSAGGGLAAALVQRIRDGEAPHPAAQWLFCPMLDDRTAVQRALDAERHFVWDNRLNRYGWGAYLGSDLGGATTPPYAVPARRADLSGLPAAWVGIGDIDLFFEEDMTYARRLEGAGVPVTLDVVPGAPHAFEVWGARTTTSTAYMARARHWLACAIGSPR
jgi:acetyl esterase/lipase